MNKRQAKKLLSIEIVNGQIIVPTRAKRRFEAWLDKCLKIQQEQTIDAIMRKIEEQEANDGEVYQSIRHQEGVRPVP